MHVVHATESTLYTYILRLTLDKEPDFTIQRQTIIYTRNIHLIELYRLPAYFKI